MNWSTTLRNALRERDDETGASLARLLQLVVAWCELCDDETAKECEMKRAPAIRKILLRRFREIQQKIGKQETL